jgi:anaerobic ribonucleoside-triphosphate reductase
VGKKGATSYTRIPEKDANRSKMRIHVGVEDSMAGEFIMDENVITIQAKRKKCKEIQYVISGCAGISYLRTPTLTIKKCPQCGVDVELFSSDFEVQCNKCEFIVFNDQNLCIQWCAYAKDCVGSTFTGY